MSTVNPILAFAVPLSGLLAAAAIFVLTASSYGAKQSLSMRLLLWTVCFSFGASATQHLISIILVPNQNDPNPAATLIAFTSIAIKLTITSIVAGIMWLHEKDYYEKTGRSAFVEDLSITNGSKSASKMTKEPVHV